MLTESQCSSTAVEHFARIADSRKWQEVSILMLTGCFDASGKTPSTTAKNKSKKRRELRQAQDAQVMAVAGFASQAGMWTEFDARWEIVLQRFRVAYFHPGELAYCRGPFKHGWHGEVQKRQDFQAALMDIIESCGLRKFGSLLWTPDLSKVRAEDGLQADSTATPYVVCARNVIENFIAYAIGEGQRESVEYIFEKGDEEDKLRQHLKKHNFPDAEFRWKQTMEVKGIVRKPFLGLQAAGWIVWEYYMSFDRIFQRECQHEPFSRWAFQIFDDHQRVPGNIIIRYKSKPFLHLAEKFSASMPESMKRFRDGVAHLEAAKKEGLKS